MRGLLRSAAMLLYVILALLLNREILGKARYLVLLDWHVHTLCMLPAPGCPDDAALLARAGPVTNHGGGAFIAKGKDAGVGVTAAGTLAEDPGAAAEDAGATVQGKEP